MPVQDARVSTVPVQTEIQNDVQSDVLPRPAAVDAVRWAAALMSQLGLELDTRSPKRRAA